MIYTITPNPALDMGGYVKNLIPNEKSYVHQETRFPGGNGINAARIIKKMHQPVIASGFLGGGIGQEIEALLKKERVHCEFIKIQENTRISVTVSDLKTHLQTRFSFPGPTIQPKEIQRLFQWIKRLPPPALLVMGGSVPPGFTSHHLKQILVLAHQHGISTIVDVPGHLLRDLVESRPLLIKPNLVEFQELIGKKVTSIPDVIREAKYLCQNIPFICVSSVENGALLVTQNNVWFGKIPAVKVKTTVGAGDSMVGAMSAQLWKRRKLLVPSPSNLEIYKSGEDLLRWGLAAATATLITPGTSLGKYSDMIYFYPKVKIKLVLI